ncbi:MAG TPA: hypothetical protein VGQ30_09990 [Gemmatimonadaceae bacterium]|jgi:hypothetical protein|nr:hypothetical protein [Gemmatimonadaceae bacterium]
MDEQLDEQSPVDFSSLGPSISADRFNALVATATRRGEAELERRRGGGERTVVRVVLAWRRPVLALAGLAAAAAIALLVRTGPAAQTQSLASSTVAEELGIPAAYAESVEGTAPARGGSVRQ